MPILKTHKKLSYRSQIFFYSLLLIIIPTTLLSVSSASRSISEISEEYNHSMATIVNQASLALDILLEDATKIADMPLLSDDIHKAMITNYQDDYLSYARDSTAFRHLFKQTNRLNSNLMTCVFQSKYGYNFDYNILNARQLNQIQETIDNFRDLAASSPNHIYYAPLQSSTYSITSRNVLPMLKILYDGFDYKEIGICYAEIDLKPLEKILASSRSLVNTILIYDTEGNLTYSTDPSYFSDPGQDAALLSCLAEFSASLPEDGSITTQKITIGSSTWLVNGCSNKTTRWHILQFADNQIITQTYFNNLLSHSGIFLFSILLGLLLAVMISGRLTNSISRLCYEIESAEIGSPNGRSQTAGSSPTDCREAGYPAPISQSACGDNLELQKLIVSFNRLYLRLADSMELNYQSKLAEQKMKIQMLQFQINHHFLYNTLNTIKSLADIHHIPQIGQIAVCMSDLLRYNLENFPIAHLRDELEQVSRYLTIQSIRFPGKFLFDCSVPNSLMDFRIPTFILQPLVENSIEHGFSDKEEQCYISIGYSLDESHLHLLISDNGCGIPEGLLREIMDAMASENDRAKLSSSSGNGRSHHAIGLLNVDQRLRSYYGPEYGLAIESEVGEGTIIDITLPRQG